MPMTITEAHERWSAADAFARKRIEEAKSSLDTALLFAGMGAPLCTNLESAVKTAKTAIRAAGEAAAALRTAEGG